MTSISTIKAWFDICKANKDNTHMIIKWDYFDGPEGDYPIYVRSDQDVREVDRLNTERTIEVYAMHLPFEDQVNEYRSFHYEYPEV